MPRHPVILVPAIWAAMLVAGSLVPVLGQADPIPAAILDLTSVDPEVRYTAASVLAKAHDDGRTVEPLIRALDDPSDDVRLIAVGTLGYRKERRAVQKLISLLGDETVVAGAVVDALGNIGDPAAIEPLIEAMNEMKTGTKWLFVRALGQFRDPRVVAPLFALEAGYGESVAKAIGSLGVPYVTEILTSGSPEDRAKAAGILTYIADERALPSLVSALGDKAPWTASTASTAIRTRIGAPAVSRLFRAFSDSDRETRQLIVRTLGGIEGNESTSALLDLLRQNELATRIEVLKALCGEPDERYWGRRLYPPLSDWKSDVITVVVASVRDEFPEVRKLAIWALAGVDRDDVYRALEKALTEQRTKVEASLSIALLGHHQALGTVLNMLKSEDLRLARFAQSVLVQIGQPAVGGLIDVLRDPDPELPMREFKRREAEAKAPWDYPGCGNETPLPHADPRVRAAEALGTIGDEQARPALEAALKDKHDWLRYSSEEALRRSGWLKNH